MAAAFELVKGGVMVDTQKVRMDQVWQDNDLRNKARFLRVLAAHDGFAFVRTCGPDGQDIGGRRSRVMLSRLRPPRYTLVKEGL